MENMEKISMEKIEKLLNGKDIDGKNGKVALTV